VGECRAPTANKVVCWIVAYQGDRSRGMLIRVTRPTPLAHFVRVLFFSYALGAFCSITEHEHRYSTSSLNVT